MTAELEYSKDEDKNRARLLDIVVPDVPTTRVSVDTSNFNRAIAILNGVGNDYALVATILLNILNKIATSDKLLVVRELERSILATPTVFIANNKLLVQNVLMKFSSLED